MRACQTRARVPRVLWLALCALLVLQVGYRAAQPPPAVRVRPLPSPPSLTQARLAALGDPVLLAKSVMLWLQAFDRQPGVSVAFRELDYDALARWLELVLALDPGAELPLLAASRIYAEVPDPARSRRMLALVHREFAADPGRRWPWLAHAVYVARHRLHDDALALVYARSLARAGAPAIPDWARQLEIFVLEDLGELQAARVLLGGLLASGNLRDRQQEAFLRERLAELETRIAMHHGCGTSVENSSCMSK